MRIKSLFTMEAGEKATEKVLRRVLISSICGIVLCMTCLAGTTWAWFTVSIENTGNGIGIGKPSVIFSENETVLKSGDPLADGTHQIGIAHANDPDDLEKKSTLYVTLSVDECVIGYITLNEANGYRTDLTVITDGTRRLTWVVSWFPPAETVMLTNHTVTLRTETPGASADDPAVP